MPNTKSAVKRLRQDKKKNLKNKSAKSAIKTKIKKIKSLVSSGKIEEANKMVREIEKMVDKAKTKRIIHQNKASRTKSNLMKLISSQTKSN